MPEQPNNPLHGKRLEVVLDELVAHYGWDRLAKKFSMRCFQHEPNVRSCVVFLRKNPWARVKVERLYLLMIAKRNQ
jgi:uncharacterized protein (DUF2132 family)